MCVIIGDADRFIGNCLIPLAPCKECLLMEDLMTNYSLEMLDNYHYVFLIATPDKENGLLSWDLKG